MPNYQIQSGDTLSGISARNGVSIDSIQKANPSITDPNKIVAGSSLVIPTMANAGTSNTIQTTTGQRASDIATQNKYNDVMNSKVVATPATPTTTPTTTATGTSTGTLPTNSTGTPAGTPAGTSTGTPAGTPATNSGTTPSTPATPVADTTTSSNDLTTASNNYKAQLTARANNLNTEYTTFSNQMDQLAQNSATDYQSSIASIKANFDVRRTTLMQNMADLSTLHEKAGYLSNGFRYTPMQQEGLMTNDENNKTMNLAKLDAEEQANLLQAANAKNTKDWSALQEHMKLHDTMETQKTELMASLLKVSQQNNTQMQTDAKKAQEDALPGLKTELQRQKDIAISTVMKQGITNPLDIFAKLGGNVPLGEIIASTEKLTGLDSKNLANTNKGLQNVKLENNINNPKVPTPKGEITSGSLKVSGDDLSKISQYFESSRQSGSDGHMNTNDYVTGYNEWIQHGGLAKDFFKEFKPSLFINPSDPTVPSFIKSQLGGKKSSSDPQHP